MFIERAAFTSRVGYKNCTPNGATFEANQFRTAILERGLHSCSLRVTLFTADAKTSSRQTQTVKTGDHLL